tara:strand:+ start:63 stop:581 length:519 start_codon:yes stop_codon:yes gene_type:complete
MQESCFTKKELQSIKKPLLQIVKSNQIKNMVKLGKMIADISGDQRFAFHYNMVYVLKYFDIQKVDGYYQYIDPETQEYDYNYMECWRCEKKQKFPEFPKGVTWIKSRLKICKTCLREENLITGESYQELIGIYSFLQHKYSYRLEKWMYRRFWESYIYGKSSSVSGYKSTSS